jgi:hypothetical protein
VTLEPGDVAAERLLGDVQAGRGSSEMQLLGHGNEVAHQSKVEVIGHAFRN